MDPLSITTGCVTLVASISKLSIQVNGFIREVRDARGDLDSVSRELLSLKTVLEILADDTANQSTLPGSLQKQISGIVKNCGGVVSQIEVCLQKHSGAGLRSGIKWSISGRDDMEKLRSSLEAHKSALDIALDMLTLSMTHQIKAETQGIRNDTSLIKQDTTQILEEIAKLQAQLPETRESGSGMLQRCLDGLTTYAESTYEPTIVDFEEQTSTLSEETGRGGQEPSADPRKDWDVVEPLQAEKRAQMNRETEFSPFRKKSHAVLAGQTLAVRSVSPPDQLYFPPPGPTEDKRQLNIPPKLNLVSPGKDLSLPPVLSDSRNDKYHRSQHQDAADREQPASTPPRKVQRNAEAIAEAKKRRAALSDTKVLELDLNLKCIDDKTPVFEIRRLLAEGADPNINLASRKAPLLAKLSFRKEFLRKRLHSAIFEITKCGGVEENTAAIEVLLEYGADPNLGQVNTRCCSYNSPLERVALYGNLKAVQILLDAGANANDCNYHFPLQAALSTDSYSPPPWAVQRPILEVLINHGADVNGTGIVFHTALQMSALKGSVGAVEFLLDRGAHINVLGGSFGSALHAAVIRGHIEVVRVLLWRGANVDARALCLINRVGVEEGICRDLVTPAEIIPLQGEGNDEQTRQKRREIQEELLRCVRNPRPVP